MKGKHHVIVKNRSLHYEFDIKRNITIIQGDSGTGKTTLGKIFIIYLTALMKSMESAHQENIRRRKGHTRRFTGFTVLRSSVLGREA